MNKEKICLFYQNTSTMYYWQKWFKNKYSDYIEKSIDIERSFHLKNGTVLYFRIPADNMVGQIFDKEFDGERLELLCLSYENSRLKEMVNHEHKYSSEMEGKYILEREKNKKAIEYIKRYVFMDLPQLIKLVEILKDSDVNEE